MTQANAEVRLEKEWLVTVFFSRYWLIVTLLYNLLGGVCLRTWLMILTLTSSKMSSKDPAWFFEKGLKKISLLIKLTFAGNLTSLSELNWRAKVRLELKSSLNIFTSKKTPGYDHFCPQNEGKKNTLYRSLTLTHILVTPGHADVVRWLVKFLVVKEALVVWNTLRWVLSTTPWGRNIGAHSCWVLCVSPKAKSWPRCGSKQKCLE